MGEEAFDEVTIPLNDGQKLHITGGYGREEVYIGIQGRNSDRDGWPDMIVALDRGERTELRKALRLMMRGGL